MARPSPPTCSSEPPREPRVNISRKPSSACTAPVLAPCAAVWFVRPVIIEQHGVACGVNREEFDAFVRVVRVPGRRILAVANGHAFPFSNAIEAISRPVLDGVERQLALDSAASVESLFDAAHAAFLLATREIPEEDEFPCAQLTIADLSPGRFRAGRLGSFEPLILRDGEMRQEAATSWSDNMERVPRAPSLVECTLVEGDLVIVSSVGFDKKVSDEVARILQSLGQASPAPRALVEAALSLWTEDDRRAQEAGRVRGVPLLVLVTARA